MLVSRDEDVSSQKKLLQKFQRRSAKIDQEQCGRFPPLCKGLSLGVKVIISMAEQFCRASPHSYICRYIQPKAGYNGRPLSQYHTKFWERQMACRVHYQILTISGRWCVQSSRDSSWGDWITVNCDCFQSYWKCWINGCLWSGCVRSLMFCYWSCRNITTSTCLSEVQWDNRLLYSCTTRTIVIYIIFGDMYKLLSNSGQLFFVKLTAK